MNYTTKSKKSVKNDSINFLKKSVRNFVLYQKSFITLQSLIETHRVWPYSIIAFIALYCLYCPVLPLANFSQ